MRLTSLHRRKVGPHPEVVGFWHFEHDMKSESRNAGVGPAKRSGGGVYFFNEDVPGQFIYDPLQKLSYPNSASLSFESDQKHNDALEVALNTAKTGLAGQSLTLEFFFKPQCRMDRAAGDQGAARRKRHGVGSRKRAPAAST